jgi:flagellar secretion chaperone FliS
LIGERLTVSTYARNSKLAAYQGVMTHSGVSGADPHRLVLMLLDGALERLSIARGYLERGGHHRGEFARRAAALQQCMNILAELNGSLNLTEGGPLARNLSDLYDYMIRRLVVANTTSASGPVLEVARLLEELKGAWVAIGPDVRKAGASAPGGWNGVPQSVSDPLPQAHPGAAARA